MASDGVEHINRPEWSCSLSEPANNTTHSFSLLEVVFFARRRYEKNNDILDRDNSTYSSFSSEHQHVINEPISIFACKWLNFLPSLISLCSEQTVLPENEKEIITERDLREDEKEIIVVERCPSSLSVVEFELLDQNVKILNNKEKNKNKYNNNKLDKAAVSFLYKKDGGREGRRVSADTATTRETNDSCGKEEEAEEEDWDEDELWNDKQEEGEEKGKKDDEQKRGGDARGERASDIVEWVGKVEEEEEENYLLDHYREIYMELLEKDNREKKEEEEEVVKEKREGLERIEGKESVNDPEKQQQLERQQLKQQRPEQQPLNQKLKQQQPEQHKPEQQQQTKEKEKEGKLIKEIERDKRRMFSLGRDCWGLVSLFTFIFSIYQYIESDNILSPILRVLTFAYNNKAGSGFVYTTYGLIYFLYGLVS